MIQLRRADVQATIMRSAGLRQLRVGERELLVEPPVKGPNRAFHGELLAPWPNRVGGGLYRHGGVEHQLPINEAERGHAIHGFASGLDWLARRRGAGAVTLSSVLETQPGYPFRMEFEVHYDLCDGGISARLIARNIGDVTAPVGLGCHPYVRAGDGPLDSWELGLNADTMLDVDPATLLPTRLQDVEATSFDFRSPRPIGDQRFSRAFRLDAPSLAAYRTVTVRDPAGTGVDVVLGETSRWVQIYTGDVDDPRLRRRGLAIEPMTCPPNAFVSGLDLDIVEPGDALELAWAIRAH
ncbi:aldose 1-epimerase family protein [Microbacterium sp. A196]|uniref:aldose 1-epimerase family protein n=1 Tax=Microbacterium sp. A196 TaxID=3457320 RepID=UPI003FD2BEE6